jgi:hypothetical protein
MRNSTATAHLPAGKLIVPLHVCGTRDGEELRCAERRRCRHPARQQRTSRKRVADALAYDVAAGSDRLPGVQRRTRLFPRPRAARDLWLQRANCARWATCCATSCSCCAAAASIASEIRTDRDATDALAGFGEFSGVYQSSTDRSGHPPLLLREAQEAAAVRPAPELYCASSHARTRAHGGNRGAGGRAAPLRLSIASGAVTSPHSS